MDREGSAAEGLLLAPVDPAALYAGKMPGNPAFLTAAELFAFPLFVLFADVPARWLFPGILAVAFVANLGLAAAAPCSARRPSTPGPGRSCCPFSPSLWPCPWCSERQADLHAAHPERVRV